MANRRKSGDKILRTSKFFRIFKMKKAILNILLITSILLSFACRSAPENKANEKVLRIATSYKIQNLDPLKSAFYFLIEFNVAETPLVLGEDAKLKPALLESYEQIDALNWRLMLRPNVKFQNGRILTAEKLAAAMNRQLNQSPSAKAIISDASVKAIGERELVLTTKNPDPNVPAALADEDVFPVYDVEAMEAAGSDREKLANCACYTGAYKIVSLNDREMRLTAFADYRQGTPALDGVIVKFIGEPQARILAVQSGETDIALYPPTEGKRILANRQDAFFITAEDGRGGPRLLFNTRRPPFDEAATRRAVSLGINYESLANDVMDKVFAPADGFYAPLNSWAIQNQKTDVETAEKLLDEAGWIKNADGLRSKNNQPLEGVFLTYPQQPDWTTLATAIQAQLRKIGFNLKIRQVEDINQELKNPANWNIAINSPGILTTGGAPDPYLREYLSTGGVTNYGGVSDAELDRLINELSRTFAAEKRIEMLRRIQEIVIAEKAFEARPVLTKTRAIVGKNYRNYKPSAVLRHITFETKPDE